MGASVELDKCLAGNKAYLSSGEHTPNMKLGVSRKLVVLTCMDSRCAQ
jgi:carbonic anhydrase